MLIEKRQLRNLNSKEYNPRQITEEEQKHLNESLKKFGYIKPIVVNNHRERKNVVIDGYFVVKELEKLGFKEVDCIIVNLDLEKEKELSIRLNANTGEWDYNILASKFEVEYLKSLGVSIPTYWEMEEENKIYNNREIDLENLIKNFNCKCPKCNFEFEYKEL